MRTRVLLLLPALLTSGVIFATKDWWERRSYIEWTAIEVDEMLNESPWVAVQPLGQVPPNLGEAHVSPFIGPGDQELRFETNLDGKSVQVKFDLRKMIYRGKLEM